MKKLYVLYCLNLFFHAYSFAEQFLYPVCALGSGDILVIYQKDVDDLELWLWNEHSHVSVKQLSSLFLPSCVQIIPGAHGFSFLDRGRIRLKYFNKRMPLTVNIDEPIDSILSIDWIDKDRFYFTGKRKGQFGVFLCDISDKHHPVVLKLINSIKKDYLYPFKIDEHLFCVGRNKLDNYFILDVEWKPHLQEDGFFDAKEEIIFESEDPICFLYMNNSKLGFFLQYEVDEENEAIQFSCFDIRIVGEYWESNLLFSFRLPSQYLLGSSMKRLYESVSPFLPSYAHFPNIYYVSYDFKKDSCYLKVYNYLTKKSSSLNIYQNKAFGSHGYFAPKVLEGKLYCGLISDHFFSKSIIDTHEGTGLVVCNLPSVDLHEDID